MKKPWPLMPVSDAFPPLLSLSHPACDASYAYPYANRVCIKMQISRRSVAHGTRLPSAQRAPLFFQALDWQHRLGAKGGGSSSDSKSASPRESASFPPFSLCIHLLMSRVVLSVPVYSGHTDTEGL